MIKKEIYSFLLNEIEEEIKPKFRGKQIYNWLYNKYEQNFKNMTNLPKNLIDELDKNYYIKNLKIINIEKSFDGTKKYLFKLNDGHTVESVFLLMKPEIKENGKVTQEAKYTFCVSTQVGCKVGCEFCLTAKGGFIRNLTAGEIVAQVVELKKDNQISANKSVNIVYMGMGEPLDNFDNLIKAIDIISDKNGLCISTKRQTISTSGISDKIKKLGKLDLGVQLAISLHAVDNELRSRLIPLNKAYNIESIIEAVKKFPINKRKKVMFEYLVIKDINDDIKSAKKLVKLLDGIKAKVNLIYFNPYPGSDFKRPSVKSMENFQRFLLDKGIICTIRESKGIDISAACGQLKDRSLGVKGYRREKRKEIKSGGFSDE